jgi:hypothetical protein
VVTIGTTPASRYLSAIIHWYANERQILTKSQTDFQNDAWHGTVKGAVRHGGLRPVWCVLAWCVLAW